jgi:hypothetical protein
MNVTYILYGWSAFCKSLFDMIEAFEPQIPEPGSQERSALLFGQMEVPHGASPEDNSEFRHDAPSRLTLGSVVQGN